MCAFMQGTVGLSIAQNQDKKMIKNSVIFSDVCSCGGYITIGKASHVADEGTDPERIIE